MVLSVFLLIYIGIAFFSPEPLTTLISLTATTPLAALLALIPLNCAMRLILELRRFMTRRAAIMGRFEGEVPTGLFDESCEIAAVAGIEGLEERLREAGYHTRRINGFLSAWRGVSLSPARILLLGAWCLLFAGILLSVTMRRSQRVSVIEGEPFPGSGSAGIVRKIALEDYQGLFLERTIAIEVADNGGGIRKFGLYPPSMFEGSFVYPRYLGVAPLIRFNAPDLPGGFETHFILSIYPPGKEDSAGIPGTDYRIVFSMARPDKGDDPFRSGRMTLNFRILNGDRQAAAGSVGVGQAFNGNGFRLAFPEFRRVVVTDLVRDHGVIPIWAGVFALGAGLLLWLALRIFSPRREMLFREEAGSVTACSLAEGGRRRHGAIFFELLDLLDAGIAAGQDKIII
jgi:hypothetical protein